MSVTIRSATPSDRAAFLALWQGFLDYYGVQVPPATTEFTWARIIDPDHRMACRLAVIDGLPVGFAIHHHHCSTWVPGDDVYLEDLFVTPSARGQGVGRALITDLIDLAREQGWHRLYWNTNHDNATARRLYDSFCKDDGHIRYRLSLR